MKHGSLFSGIGGFDLAAEWMGWENVFHCEWNPFGQKILKYYWPNAKSYEDITKSDFTIHRGKIDILTGGFPCQPYSLAGKRKGKEDERHLWPEMLRAIREIQPRWIVGENVFGLVNWSGGLVFHEVQSDLEAEGYEVQSYVLPAAAVNAPHRRDRIWFVAYSNGNGFNECNSEHELNTSEGRINALSNTYESNGNGDAANTESERLQRGNKTWEESNINREDTSLWRSSSRCNQEIDNNVTDSNSTNSEAWTQREVLGQSDREKANGYSNVECRNQWQNFPTISPICYGDDGLSNRLDNITFSKWRNESIKGGGNAIVAQVVYEIFKAIESYEHIQTSH